MAKKLKTYRMYRGTMTIIGGWPSRDSGYYGGGLAENFKSTARTFQAKTHKAATIKMDKFIKDAQIIGSFFVKVIDG